MTRRVPTLFASSLVVVPLLLTALVGCSSDDTATSGGSEKATTTAARSAIDDLRLNEVQMIGTHNSYHIAPEPKVFDAEKAAAASLGDAAAGLGNIDSLNYTHQPLTQQLDSGVRSFELDVWADPQGGLFAKPLAPSFLNIPDAQIPTGLDQPGFKVLHIVDIDFRSTCPTFVACLTEIKTWSDAHPNHMPIIINVELKDDALPAPLDITKVVKIDAAQMDAFDAEVRSVLSDDDLLTPDDVRGSASTLSKAVTTTGWPTLEKSRGQVMLFMDNAGDYRTDYLAGHPSLEGRVMFTSSAGENDPDRAVVKLNDANDPQITPLVKQGFLIRTRADEDVVEVAAGKTEGKDAALASGAQIVSTDFPIAEPSPTGYEVALGTGVQVRCNPVIATTCPKGSFEP